MSDLERDIEKARANCGARPNYDAASLERIRRRAAEVYQEYEKDMERRVQQEMIDEYKYHLHP